MSYELRLVADVHQKAIDTKKLPKNLVFFIGLLLLFSGESIAQLQRILTKKKYYEFFGIHRYLFNCCVISLVAYNVYVYDNLCSKERR